METRSNNATHNRPDGDRPIDAPLVLADLHADIQQLKSENAWQHSDRNAVALFHNAALRVVLVALHEGAELNRTISSAASLQVLEGRIWLESADASHSMDAPAIAALQGGAPYHIHAEAESVLLLTIAGPGGEDDY